MRVHIRPGRREDIEPARAVERAAGRRFEDVGRADVAAHEPTDAAALQERCADGRLFVAEANEAVVGFAIFSMLDGAGYLEEVAVAPAYGRRGLGEALVEAVAAEAASRGARAVTLSTFRGVPWNAPWYARLGFTETTAEALGPGHAVQVAQHAANGLDPADRAWMIRPLG